MFKKIAAMLAEIIGFDDEDIYMETKLDPDHGIEPIDLAKLIIECEKEFGVEIYDEDVHTFKEIGDIVRYIRNIYDGN